MFNATQKKTNLIYTFRDQKPNTNIGKPYATLINSRHEDVNFEN